jgi:uncharacterized membrane protein
MPLESIELTEEQRSRFELEAREKGRLETFIDAVVAIAITLLGLEFVVPELEHTNESLLSFLGGMYPEFLGYFLAFFLLAFLLSTSWRQFQNIRYADWKLYTINIIFLTFIVLVPFATSVLTEFGDTTTGVLFFQIVIFLSVLTLYLNWWYVRKHPYLLKKDITSMSMRAIYYRNIALLTASGVAIVLAFFTPVFSNLAYVLIIVIAVIARPIRSKK